MLKELAEVREAPEIVSMFRVSILLLKEQLREVNPVTPEHE